MVHAEACVIFVLPENLPMGKISGMGGSVKVWPFYADVCQPAERNRREMQPHFKEHRRISHRAAYPKQKENQ
jgi:hypothetical protein